MILPRELNLRTLKWQIGKMGRKKHSRQLQCYMNDNKVGILTFKQNQLSFQYDKNWLTLLVRRPLSLSLPLQAQAHKGDTVYSYFENLLPDNDSVRKQIVDRLGAYSRHPFDLLRVVGADCIGAIRLIDEDDPVKSSDKDYERLNESEVAELLRQTASGETMGMQADDEFRISLAGAQEKTALTLIDNQWYRPHGKLPTTHILKLPIYTNNQFGPDLTNSVENEWFHLELFRNLGLKTAECSILQFEDIKVLSVERFDRKRHKDTFYRVPQEDLCQALGFVSGSKYEDKGGPGIAPIMELLSNSLTPIVDRETFMKTLVCSWLIAATDAHAKNFSIYLKPDGFQLTPTYDVLSVYPYFGQGSIQSKKIKMAMAMIGKNRHYIWDDIQRRHFISTARHVKFSVDRMVEIIEDIKKNFPDALNKTIESSPYRFPEDIIKMTSKFALKKLKQL